jgi:phosphoribosyl 1,2-cyclic phosphodiesterase
LNSRMVVKLWGVRGSIPSPGPATARYGGNTTCVSVEIGDAVLIFDAGSGIRNLGKELFSDPRAVVIFLTHLHWDHVQGLLFFAPLYQPGRTLAIETPDRTMTSLVPIAGADGVHFPLTAEQILSDLRVNQGDPIGDLAKTGIVLRRLRMNHPGLCHGFRLEYGGRVLVFIPDNEIHPPEPGPLAWNDLVAFCQGADVLIHDAQYLAEEISSKRGWGHSTIDDACALGKAAGAKRLILFHHDPERTDGEIDDILAKILPDSRGATEISAAKEGTVLHLVSEGQAAGLL